MPIVIQADSRSIQDVLSELLLYAIQYLTPSSGGKAKTTLGIEDASSPKSPEDLAEDDESVDLDDYEHDQMLVKARFSSSHEIERPPVLLVFFC